MVNPAIANPEDFIAQFNKALNAASSSRLRHIIRDLCRLLPPAISIVSDTLLVTEDQVAVERDDADSNSDSESDFDSDAASETSAGEPEPADGILEVRAPPVPVAAARKRLRPRYAVCVQCEAEYDVTLNDRESCYYHPAPPEPDDDAWAEHDEYMRGDVNTEEMRQEYPDKFYYPCCDREYGEEGCKVDWHEEDTSGRKRRRY
ncbi:uncharacterized protein CDV56_109054 [Aspergillus thermomutatus]|uniref:Uncharacterized protein n=1 Tax=Aspergillus thermomutatus TaxID=41047 RepID=A0A397HSH7_ASPTH|nr:uncharacterized protein CDV56_109054 [Aspergillus thermomutatus]RHZ65982.1 hypothetical protein CDV56_109054 [Aspergillus thermomutatus]